MDASGERGAEKDLVLVKSDSVGLEGNLEIPDGAKGIVMFAHGSGSSRFSPRNQFVARALREAGLATLLIDLLTQEEEASDRWSGQYRFDIDLLTRRLVGATDWLSQQARTAGLRIGYFGASTGAAAALRAATERPYLVHAVVSRGGRPDLATEALPLVKAPTLLIVGGADTEVLELNRRTLATICAEKRLEIVPGATHLFEESGALEAVADLASRWFTRYLTSRYEAVVA